MLISNLNQFTTYTTFLKGLMHYQAAHDHPILNNLAIYFIYKYRDARPIISRFLKLEALKGSCASPFSSEEPTPKEYNKYTQETERARHERNTFLWNWLCCVLLHASISQMNQATKVCSFWTLPPLLKMLPEKYNTSKYCDYHQDGCWRTEANQRKA